MNPKVIKDVGKISLFTGVWQVVFTSAIGFVLCRLLWFDILTSTYISVAIAFSSTIVIMKLLSDKGDLNTLYGKISLGFLIVQDVIAMLILMFVSFSGWEGSVWSIVFQLLVKGVGLVLCIVLFGIYVLPRVMRMVAKSQELLELFAIAWCLLLASVFHLVWFSIEIWALIAGVTLSMSPYRFQISSKMKGLRDFFIVIFFVLFWTHMTLDNIWMYILPIVILSFFILIGNPIIVMTIMWLLWYSKKNWFKAGLTVAQISEFSFILIILWVNVGHLNREILSLTSIIGLITIAGSTYFILYSNQIYAFLSPYLSIFERKDLHHKDQGITLQYEIILFWYDVVSFEPIETLRDKNKECLVVDYDPNIIKHLEARKVNCIYGDAGDLELLDDIIHDNVKMIVSVSKDIETNSILIEKFKYIDENIIIIVTADTMKHATQLYEKWATYVMIPHFVWGLHLSQLIKDHSFDIEKFRIHKDAHLKKINDVYL